MPIYCAKPVDFGPEALEFQFSLDKNYVPILYRQQYARMPPVDSLSFFNDHVRTLRRQYRKPYTRAYMVRLCMCIMREDGRHYTPHSYRYCLRMCYFCKRRQTSEKNTLS